MVLKTLPVLVVDLGTSWLKGSIIDAAGETVHRRERRSMEEAQVAGLPDGWSEQDPRWIAAQAEALLDELLHAGAPAPEVSAIAFTAQMHGVLLVSTDGEPLSNLIDWRDRRALEPCPGTPGRWLDALLGSDDPWPVERTGCRPACGYGATTLYWLAHTGNLPRASSATICTLADFIVARLAAIEPVTDPSLAASTALFDLHAGNWLESALERVGSPRLRLPRCVAGGTPVGTWRGIPLLAPIGDAAAASHAVLGERGEQAHLNYGTGSQIVAPGSLPDSAAAPDTVSEEEIETRPAAGGGVLSVAAGSVGGQTLETWRRMFEGFRASASETVAMEDLLDEARRATPGCAGLRMDPRFFGTRTEPQRTATLRGITPETWRRGRLFRACLEGMTRIWRDDLRRIEARAGHRFRRLALSGRLFSEQPFVVEMVAQCLGVETRVVPAANISALGAARLACRQRRRLPTEEAGCQTSAAAQSMGHNRPS